jgi:hypothetical protein
MADTSIEWTDATWNPVAGCTVLSPGCTNCYAMRMAMSDPVTPLEFPQRSTATKACRFRCECERRSKPPYVHPKLTVTANFNSGLGSGMEAMMTARGIPTVIDAKPREWNCGWVISFPTRKGNRSAARPRCRSPNRPAGQLFEKQ